MKRYIFMIVVSCMSILLLLYGVWDAYQPRVGPVGNGPDDSAILKWFLLHVLSPVCFLLTAIIGIYQLKKKK